MLGKSYFSSFFSLALVAVVSMFVTSCGSSSSGPTGYNVSIEESAMGLTTGKSSFQIKVTKKSDGSAASGLASKISLYPLMHMSTMNHSSPVPSDAVSESSTPGTYDCTIYFLMATMSATEYWELQVTVDGDTTTLTPNVSMAMGSDTVRATLKNNMDMIMSMGGSMSARSYYLFKDSVNTDMSGGTVTLFLATQQEGLMTMPPVVAGMSIMDMNNASVQMTVNSLDVSVSTDGATWSSMACDSSARCSAHVNGLAAGVSTKLYVKLNINGMDYTTDGAAVSSINSYAAFTVTPGSSMSM